MLSTVPYEHAWVRWIGFATSHKGQWHCAVKTGRTDGSIRLPPIAESTLASFGASTDQLRACPQGANLKMAVLPNDLKRLTSSSTTVAY